MSFLSSNSRTCEKVELRPKQCIDAALKPLLENINIRINGSLSSKDLFYTAMCMAVDKGSVHSAPKHYQEIPCVTSLRYHLRKLSLEELIQTNQRILLHSSVGTLKPEKKYEFAIDFTNDSYYGKVDSEFLQDKKISHITPVVKKGKAIKQLLNGRKARSAEYCN